MKKFSDYLTESVRQYQYSVKLAFKPSSDTMTQIEQALAKYQIVDITAPKSLPIQRVDKDFPGISSPETYAFTVTTAYPSTPNMIRHTIAMLGLELETVAVSNTMHDMVVDAEENAIAANTNDGVALLDMDYSSQDNKKLSGDNYGDSYNTKLVKNSIGSTDQIIPKELKKTKGETLNDPKFAVGTKSALGSTKNNLPKVTSFAR